MIYHGHFGYLDDLPTDVRNIERVLRPHRNKFDFIIATGMSGVLVGAPVSMRLRRPLVVLRKPDDENHSGHDLIGYGAARGRYLFLDDFISYGSTYDRIRRRMDGKHTTYAGAYLYSDNILSWQGDGVITYHPAASENDHLFVGVDRYAADIRSAVTPDMAA